MRRYTIQGLYELALLQPGPDRVWKLVCAMEAGLVLGALRMGLAHDSLAARGMVNRGSLWVNGARHPMPHAGFLQPGDLLHPAPHSVAWFRTYLGSQLGMGLMRDVAADWVPQGPAGLPGGGRGGTSGDPRGQGGQSSRGRGG